MDLDQIKREIEHMRRQVDRQRREIKDLENARIDTASAKALLVRMQDKVHQLSLRRDEMEWAEKPKYLGSLKVINGTPARRRA